MISFPTLYYPKTNKAYQRPVFDGICVTVLSAYFLHFALPALRGGFREDEMMNMGTCSCAGALKSILANLVFWKLFLCSACALYHFALYHLGDAFSYLLL